MAHHFALPIGTKPLWWQIYHLLTCSLSCCLSCSSSYSFPRMLRDPCWWFLRIWQSSPNRAPGSRQILLETWTGVQPIILVDCRYEVSIVQGMHKSASWVTSWRLSYVKVVQYTESDQIVCNLITPFLFLVFVLFFSRETQLMETTFTFLSTLIVIEVDGECMFSQAAGASIWSTWMLKLKNAPYTQTATVEVQSYKFSGIINRNYEWLMFWQNMTQ